MEPVERFISIEQARNAAVAWLESRNVVFGPYRKVEIGRLGVLAGHEVGVSAAEKPYWRLRLDFDPIKGPHFNAETGEGAKREKQAFSFPGDEALIKKLALSRRPR
ncbi:MAG: hypothetical protein P4L85_29075 [Paludisphaera borealis]|uniref:hypothetical protein n=1 Tax=Paludisphaera borealis TaxID=1387353 RepID=UPI00283F8B93|nr:hypothetical protein [Paludisphaera borealis]MDR3623421.1 hypothetical protein [Paludisphaera borealis]